MKLHQPFQTLVLAGIVAGAFVTACSADIIYQDTFTRDPAGLLNGSAPTTDNTGAGATWTASVSDFSCDGTYLVVNDNNGGHWPGAATLPLDWTTTYPNPRAQVDMKVGQAGDWLSLSFGDGNYYSSPTTALLQLKGNGDVVIRQSASWNGDWYTVTFPAAGKPLDWNRLRIELSNTLGVVSYYINGTLLTNVACTSHSLGVGLNSNVGANSQVTNLLVTFGNETITPPSISTNTPLQGATVFVGDPISIGLTASGTLPLQYIWCKDGAPIPGGPNGGTFAVASAAMSDSGNYSVIITNASGAVTSSVVRVDVHLETQTPVTQINFDDFNTYNFLGSWSWVSDNPTDPASELPTTHSESPGDGVGGSTGFRATCDTTYFQANSVSWAGFSAALGLALPKLPTANLDFYEFYFSARVENLGLESDLMTPKTNTPGRVDIRFWMPDPVNVGKSITVATVDQHFTWTSNYQSFAFVLDRASCSPADRAALAANLAKINATQIEFSSDSIYKDFAPGPSTAIVLDNIKLALRQSPAIRATPGGTTAILHWDDPNVQLMGAANVAGPYTVITGATSPYTVPADSPHFFFRTGFMPVPGP